jgi:predicted DNA-binding protein (MmcQ/YjbR family)
VRSEKWAPTLKRLRALCLAYPETTETTAWGHPNFKAGSKTFAAFEIWQGRPSMAFRLTEAEVNRLARRRSFFATPYGRGRWVSVWADEAVDWTGVSSLVERSYRGVALKRMIAALDGRRG